MQSKFSLMEPLAWMDMEHSLKITASVLEVMILFCKI